LSGRERDCTAVCVRSLGAGVRAIGYIDADAHEYPFEKQLFEVSGGGLMKSQKTKKRVLS
jgi:hypothetical protein